MRSSRALTVWLPLLLWAGLIFALSSIPGLTTGLGLWDLVLRKLAHATEYAVLGALLLRALGRGLPAFAAGVLYAASDELHQHFVPGRRASPIDLGIDTLGVLIGILVLVHLRRTLLRAGAEASGPEGGLSAVAVELDGALADTRPLWREWVADAARRFRAIAELDPETLPSDRGEAARELDRWAAAGVGDWRSALERFAEDRAPLHFRPRAEASAALRRLQAAGVRVGAFTDAPEPLARIALEHVGASRRIDLVETGPGALERLLARLGQRTPVLRSPEELSRAAP